MPSPWHPHAALITALARGDVLPATAGVELPANVVFPVGYTISMKRVFELARQALDRYPMLEAQALRVLWMTRYEEAWAHLQPGMRKGNPRSIEVGMRVAERRRKCAASTCRRSSRSRIPMAAYRWRPSGG